MRPATSHSAVAQPRNQDSSSSPVRRRRNRGRTGEVEVVQREMIMESQVSVPGAEIMRSASYSADGQPRNRKSPESHVRRGRSSGGRGAGNVEVVQQEVIKEKATSKQLDAAATELEFFVNYHRAEAQKRRNDRKNQFLEVLQQIQKLSDEVNGSMESNPPKINVDEGDLSLRKLEELHRQLHSLQKERSDHMKQIHDLLKLLNSLSNVLGLDLKNAANEVHPSLGDLEGSMNISNETIKRLANAIENLCEVKLQRMQKLQDLASSMLELWHLMDTPVEEQQMFQNVTCNIAAMEHEITEPNMLSVNYIKYVEAEVDRLEELKASKMKELVLKKRLELEEIYRKTHLVPEAETAMDCAIDAIDSGSINVVCVLEQIELQIEKVKKLHQRMKLQWVKMRLIARQERCRISLQEGKACQRKKKKNTFERPGRKRPGAAPGDRSGGKMRQGGKDKNKTKRDEQICIYKI